MMEERDTTWTVKWREGRWDRVKPKGVVWRGGQGGGLE